jgi:hypothetical protein
MRSTRLLACVLLMLALLPVLLVLPALLLAQDSTVVVADRTGAFGLLIDHYFGAIVALIQSGLTWVFTKESAAWRRIPEVAKWGVLYAIGYVLTFISLKTGFGGATIDGNALTTAGVLAAVPTLASGLIFKLGGHKVVVASVSSQRIG